MSRAEYDDGYSLGFAEAADADQDGSPLRVETPRTEDWTRGYRDGRRGWRLVVEAIDRV